ncbi:uncharacterized protein TNCV_2143571 [Trichonephila clavipes]|nr:uncharacterized protein TNCV_2143571 [Trichonephila clavipes]
MSSVWKPLASQTVMAWSQWNTRYSVPGSELLLKQPTSNSSLYHCSTNFSSNFCHRRSTMCHSRTPYTSVFLSVVPRGHPEPGILEAVSYPDHFSQQSCTVDTFRPSISAISPKDNPLSRNPLARPHSNPVRC